MFRSTSLRLAVLYTAIFAASVVVLGVVTLFSTRHALSAQFDARIRAESAALVQEYRSEGLQGVVDAVHERDNTPGSLDFGLQGPNGAALAGRLATTPVTMGWSSLRRDHRESLRLYSVALPDGYKLVVGDDEERVETLDGAVLRGFGLALLGVVILGAAGGYGLSRGVNRRIAAISGAAEAIIDGDLSRRVPVRSSDDDLDRLALTFNRMLDRISGLMESLKQVSNDIAHDMRTPLTRLRQKLEAGLAAPQIGPEARDLALESVLSDLDSILETFAALLRIAQIEGGARRAAFRPCELATLAQTVTEAFAPSAEDQHQSLSLVVETPAVVDGDAELLTQMLVNLVENALRHTGPNAAITVRVGRAGRAASLSVADDGPGVPEAERERLFDRFYRLERSRSTPGSGLGLALVAAVAKLHGAEISLASARPGLQVRVNFPEAA